VRLAWRVGADAVIGECVLSVFGKFGDVRSFLAFQALCNGGIWQLSDRSALFDSFKQLLHFLDAIWHRIRIRHGTYCRIPPSCCCPCACFNRLFMLSARLSQMDMDVDESWKQ